MKRYFAILGTVLFLSAFVIMFITGLTEDWHEWAFFSLVAVGACLVGLYLQEIMENNFKGPKF